jgi:hypothetical protein
MCHDSLYQDDVVVFRKRDEKNYTHVGTTLTFESLSSLHISLLLLFRICSQWDGRSGQICLKRRKSSSFFSPFKQNMSSGFFVPRQNCQISSHFQIKFVPIFMLFPREFFWYFPSLEENHTFPVLAENLFEKRAKTRVLVKITIEIHMVKKAEYSWTSDLIYKKILVEK